MDLLNIHPSASKPSLISSFWSLHVQFQQSENWENDLKSCSQTSLPEAVQPSQINRPFEALRTTKSLSDLQSSHPEPCLLGGDTEPSARMQEDTAEKQRRISFSVQEWLRMVDAHPAKTPTSA